MHSNFLVAIAIEYESFKCVYSIGEVLVVRHFRNSFYVIVFLCVLLYCLFVEKSSINLIFNHIISIKFTPTLTLEFKFVQIGSNRVGPVILKLGHPDNLR